MRKQQLMNFGGVNCAVDPAIISDRNASFAVNARVEDGQVRPRYGFRNLRAPQSGFSAVFGLGYLQGYSNATENEEYVTVETVSGNTRFYSSPADDGSPAVEIKNGVASVNVDPSEWTFVSFDESAYFLNPANTKPIFIHTINDPTSLTALDIPSAPTVAPSYIIKYGGGATPYTQLDYAGITVATEITYTGGANTTDSSLAPDNSLIIGHADGASNEIASSVEIQVLNSTAGAQDYTYNDKFALTLTCLDPGFRLDATSIRPNFRTSGGTVLTPDYVNVKTVTTGNQFSYLVQFGWNDKPTRSTFAAIGYLKISYTVADTDGTNQNRLKISPMWEGGIDMTAPVDRTPDIDGLQVGYSYYFSTPGFESGLSPVLIIPNSNLIGYSPGSGIDPMGVQLEITVTASGDANVDQFRVYATGTTDTVFHRIATQSDGDLTYDLRASYLEIQRLPEFEPTPFEKQSEFLGYPANAFPYRGSLVWLYNQGESNIKYSRVGDPIRQASDSDPIDDDGRGATFTMADNAADSPLGGVQVGDSAMIAGKYGVYAQFGDFPAQMTPPRKVSGSFGVAGKYAFCRFKSDNGIPGMAYVSRDGQIYFATPGGFSAQETGDNLLLTDPIRDGIQSMKAWLIDGQPEFSFTDYSEAQLITDEQQESLICIMGARGFILRRRDIDGARSWEPCEWETGGAKIRYANGSTKRRVRWITSDGYLDENEYNSTTREYITGLLRDRGREMPQAKWRSKKFVNQNRRLSYVKAYRDDLDNAPHIVDYCTRVPLGVDIIVPTGNLGTRPAFDVQGTEHTIEIRLHENDEPYTRLEMEWSPCGNRREA